MGQPKLWSSLRRGNNKADSESKGNRAAIPAIQAALAISYVAYTSLNRDEHWLGLALLGVAGLILAILIRPIPTLPYPNERQLALAKGWRRWLGVGLLMIGVILIAQSATIFLEAKPFVPPVQSTWETFGFGLLLWVVGGVLLTEAAPRKWNLDKLSLGLLTLILVVAAFLRLYRLDTLPFGMWIDEGFAGIDAHRVMAEDTYRPFFVPIINITFPHLLLYVGGLDLFGETNILGLRIVSALFGIGGVGMAFVVGNMLRGRWFGLLMAFFMATFAWAINFSRIAMTGVETSFFTLLAFYFLAQMIRGGRLRDALWAGLSIGVGLYFYAAFRLILIALAVYGFWAARWWKPQVIAQVGFAGLTAALTFLPILIFTQVDPELFYHRSEQVSIFREENRSGDTLETAIESNIEKHLLMFHVEGDANGRHNLPYEPMLDPITGILVVLGLMLSMRRLHHAEEWFFIGVLITGLSAAIITLPFEAPQALRAIGVLPALAYFGALAVMTIGQNLFQQQPAFRPVIIAVGLGLLGWILFTNYQDYFERRPRDSVVWASHSAKETLLSRLILEREGHQIFTTPLIFAEPSTMFYLPDFEQRARQIFPPDSLPLRISPNSPATIFLDTDEQALLQYAHLLYPNARYSTIQPADYGVTEGDSHFPLMTVIDLSPADIAGVQGLEADGSGVLYIPYYGNYRFYTDGTLLIDDQLIEPERQYVLAQGNHAISLTPGATLEWEIFGDTTKTRETVPTWMFYRSPITNNGLHGYFYHNANWTGQPSLERIDPFLDTYFHRIPMQRPYTVSWKGYLNIPQTGDYGIRLDVITEGSVSIDGQEIIRVDEISGVAPVRLTLEAGRHPIEVRLLDATNYSRIYLYWSVGNELYVPIPREVLEPY